jgi:circadian clock protein KaiC
MDDNFDAKRISTGIAGLDAISMGGLPENRLYVVEGTAGSGKTTLATKFLLDGVGRGEEVLFVSFSEAEIELKLVASSHGWELGDSFHLYVPDFTAESSNPDSDFTIFEPGEVELNELMRSIFDQVERIRPKRVVFDSLSELRLLARDPLRYRRLIIGLKIFFATKECTVIFTDELTVNHDPQLQSIAHGLITLEQTPREYGPVRRRVRLVKLRGSRIQEGYHDFVIRTGGLEVFPNLVAKDHHRDFAREQYSSGIEALDRLLGGGLMRGSSTLISGPAGVGKSSIACAYSASAASRGEHAALFVFEENKATVIERADGLGMPFDRHVKSGNIAITQVNPAEFSPGEFVSLVRSAVEKDRASVVVIDSLNGYMAAMPDENFLLIQMHELLTYLNQQGVVSLIITAQNGIVGSALGSPVDASYLADGMIAMRYFESGGIVRQAISVIKKRHGSHERTIREIGLSSHGIAVGEPITDFEGVLSGVPRFTGRADDLLRRQGKSGGHSGKSGGNS